MVYFVGFSHEEIKKGSEVTQLSMCVDRFGEKNIIVMFKENCMTHYNMAKVFLSLQLRIFWETFNGCILGYQKHPALCRSGIKWWVGV